MPRVKLFDQHEIIEKALNLFWKKGYYATSMQDLVDHLGINRASIYDTFGNKREFFDKAFRHYQNENLIELKEFLATQESVKIAFNQLFHNAILRNQSDTECKGCFVVNSTIELVPNDMDTTKILVDHRTHVEQIFKDQLELGVKNGEIPKSKNPAAIASIFYTYLSGLNVVTKIDFDLAHYSDSIDSLLVLLD